MHITLPVKGEERSEGLKDDIDEKIEKNGGHSMRTPYVRHGKHINVILDIRTQHHNIFLNSSAADRECASD